MFSRFVQQKFLSILRIYFTIMQLGSLLNAVQQYSFNLARDLQQYVEVQSGKAVCQPAQFEQVEIDNKGQEQQQQNRLQTEEFEDFHLDVDQPNVDTGSSIKTYQFNSGLFAPSKVQHKIINSIPDVKIEVQECFGFNSKDKSSSVILSPTCYCFAVGCQLVIASFDPETQQKAYGMFQEHVYQICRVSFQPKRKTLISGSRGLKPEVIVWKFQEETASLKLLHKFRLPRHFEGIGQITFLSQTKIIFTNSISIHRGNEFKLYDIQSGAQLKFEKKIKAKILDCFLDEGKKLYLATNGGIMALSNIEQDPEITTISEKKDNSISICCFKKFILTGDQSGDIQILTQTGKRVSKNNIHKGLVFNMHIIPQKQLLLTSGTQDNQVKIYLLVQKQSSLTLSLSDTLKMSSYCTSISHINQQNVLLAFRDGSIIVYDCKNKQRKLEKISYISCVEQNSSTMLCYNETLDKMLFTYNKNILCQLTPQNCLDPKQSQPKISKLKNQVRCVAIFQDKILQLSTLKDKKYVLQVSKISALQTSQSSMSLNFQTEKQGKPKKAAFNQQLAVVGTKYGYVIIFLLQKPVSVVSEEHHSSDIEDIIFQQGKIKPNEPFYFKTVSGSELFYWEVQILQGQISVKTINKAGPLKNLTWRSICKYSWQTRNIWEQLTHYSDIQSVAKNSNKYICTAMSDGKLRIYRYPATKGNFVEYKIFPDRFNLLSCSKNSLICVRNYEFLLINLITQQN